MHDEADVTWWAVDDRFTGGKKAVRLCEALSEPIREPREVPSEDMSEEELRREVTRLREVAAELRAEAAMHAAFHIWLVAGVDSAANLLDGRVRLSNLRALSRSSREVFAHAVAALRAPGGLFDPGDDAGEVVMHDWAQCNPTRAQVEAKRLRDAARKRGENPDRPPTSAPTPRGVAVDSERTPNAPLPSPPLPISHTPARAREEQASIQDVDPDRAPLLAALRSHKVLADLGHERLVDGIMAHRVACPGVQVAWYVQAIAEAVGSIHDEQAGGSWLTANDKAKRVGSYCRRAKAPQANGSAHAPRGAPFDPDAARRAANEAERAAKARRERAAPSPAPTPEERAKNAELAKAARAAVTQVGRLATTRSRAAHPEPIATSAGALASMAEVDAAAAERGRAEARRLAEWEAAEQQREAVAT